MKLLSKKHLRRVAVACELVETAKEKYSCLAIEYGVGEDEHVSDAAKEAQLADQYAAFYGQCPTNTWGFDDKDDRLIAMLLFAEVEGGGVEQVL